MRDKELQKTYNVSKDVASYLDHAHKVMPIRKGQSRKKYYTFEQHKKTFFKDRPSTQFLKDYRFGINQKLKDEYRISLEKVV